jgi:NTE family protein
MTEVYAVFEGGGVKGIALVAALQRASKEKELRFKGYAGASAGAIVAALAAVGYTPKELKNILEKLDYMSFLEDADKVPLDLLQGHMGFLEGLFSQNTFAALKQDMAQLRQKKGWKFAWYVWRLWKKHRHYQPEFEQLAQSVAWLIEYKGFYQTSRFQDWLRKLLEEKAKEAGIECPVTFKTLWKKNILLKVVTTDVGRRKPLVYSHYEARHREVAEAVQASMSIPLFFRPYPDGDNFMVDGGMVSNFPAWVFDTEQEEERNSSPNRSADAEKDVTPVLGFRLVAGRPVPCLKSFGDYVTGLYHTALGGTDELQTRRVSKLFLIPIQMPPWATATKFDLSDVEKQSLYMRGELDAETFFQNTENRQALALDGDLG